jgi:hypothetical protein
MESNAMTGMKRESVWIIAAVLLLAVGAWVLLFVNPLPSDEEMISHFRQHRNEIEALVGHYRNYQSSEEPSVEWGDLPEVVALKKKSGVKRVTQAGPIWFPNPYTAQTARELEFLARTDGRALMALSRRRGSLKIELTDSRYAHGAIVRTSVAAVIWKDYFFFPEVPKIDQQRLWYPVDVDGQFKSSDRVLTSLNSYPVGWKKSECVFRSIESQWFIRMCWGA